MDKYACMTRVITEVYKRQPEMRLATTGRSHTHLLRKSILFTRAPMTIFKSSSTLQQQTLVVKGTLATLILKPSHVLHLQHCGTNVPVAQIVCCSLIRTRTGTLR